MAVQTQLLTVAKIAESWGVPRAKLAKRIKEEGVQADQVKAGCSYFDPIRLEGMRKKLAV